MIWDYYFWLGVPRHGQTWVDLLGIPLDILGAIARLKAINNIKLIIL